MTSEEYASKRLEIRAAAEAIDKQRVYCQAAALNEPGGTTYTNEVIAFYHKVHCLAEIARELAYRLANNTLETSTGGES